MLRVREDCEDGAERDSGLLPQETEPKTCGGGAGEQKHSET